MSCDAHSGVPMSMGTGEGGGVMRPGLDSADRTYFRKRKLELEQAFAEAGDDGAGGGGPGLFS